MGLSTGTVQGWSFPPPLNHLGGGRGGQTCRPHAGQQPTAEVVVVNHLALGASDWRVRGASVARPWRVRFPARGTWQRPQKGSQAGIFQPGPTGNISFFSLATLLWPSPARSRGYPWPDVARPWRVRGASVARPFSENPRSCPPPPFPLGGGEQKEGRGGIYNILYDVTYIGYIIYNHT